jgi:hypothetical protein
MEEDVSGGQLEPRTLEPAYVGHLFRRRSFDPEAFVCRIGKQQHISIVVFHHVDFSTCTSKFSAYVSLTDVDLHVLRIDDKRLGDVRSILERRYCVKLQEAQSDGSIRLLVER